MGSIYLNEEAFGGGAPIILSTGAPSANIGSEGSLYGEIDNTYLAFNGKETSNKWAEPVEIPLDISKMVSIKISFKDNSSYYYDQVALKSNMTQVWGSATYVQLSSHVWAGYDPNDLTKLLVNVDTSQNLIVYKVVATMTDNSRIKTIYGKTNNEWLPYQPYELIDAIKQTW